jgi:hypothetical protein
MEKISNYKIPADLIIHRIVDRFRVTGSIPLNTKIRAIILMEKFTAGWAT